MENTVGPSRLRRWQGLFMDKLPTSNQWIRTGRYFGYDLRKRVKNLVVFCWLYDNLPELAKRHQIERVIVAIPSLDPSEYERIRWCSCCVKCYKMPKVEIFVVQAFYQAGTGFQKLIRTLGRQEPSWRMRLGAELDSKTILVTGAGGLTGSEICRQGRFNLNALSCSVMENASTVVLSLIAS